MKRYIKEKRDCSCKKTPLFENFNKTFYHDGYEDAYHLGYSDAKLYNNLELITDDEEEAIFDLVYTIAIDNWGADYELVEDPKFIKEVIRGYNDGIMDYREKDSNREYSRMDNEIYRRHHGVGLNEGKEIKDIEEFLGIKDVYYISYGELKNPEIKYKNFVCDYFEFEDSLYSTMEELIYDGEDWGDPDEEEDFINFAKENEQLVKDIIEDLYNYYNRK